MNQADLLKYQNIIDRIYKLNKLSIIKNDKTNPFLNLGKPTVENIKRLEFLVPNHVKIRFVLNLLICIPKLVYDSTCNLLHHLKYIKSYSDIVLNDQQINFLFVSHYIGQNNVGKNNDIFYGSIPDSILNNSKKNLLVYIDHTKKQNAKKRKLNSNILSKTCDSRTRLRMIISNINNSTLYLKKLLRSLFINFEEANSYLQLAMIQTKISSSANEILTHNLSRYINAYKPNKIVFTLEGHPYELYLANYLCKKYSEIEIVFWQLAPVVSSQHGFLENIASFGPNSKIAVTGNAVKTYIENSAKKHPDLYVIGSPKFQTNEHIKSKGKCILLAPEGTKEAVYEFLDLIPKICEEIIEYKVVLRLHPSVGNLKNSRNLWKYEKYSNFEISNKSLSYDLSRSEYCVFRSSSVGIESLNYGVQPIHFSIFNSGELNPLSLVDSVYFQAKNSTELLQIIAQHKKYNVNQLQKAYGDYFEQVDLNKLYIN